MGSFEMHQFRTIDRPLNKEEQKEIDSWSSRFSPNAHGVDYVYHYGSFKQRVETVFAIYFDAMIYFDAYGTRRLMFRFPKEIVDWRTIAVFDNQAEMSSCHLNIERKGEYVIMDMFWVDEEGGGWMEEDDYPIDAYIPLRQEILNGDYRSLFMLWLKVQEVKRLEETDDESTPIPPLPANLNDLTKSQEELIELFVINEKFIEAASQNSPIQKKETPDYQRLILSLSKEQKNDFLRELLKETPQLSLRLKMALDEINGGKELHFGHQQDWGELLEKVD